MEWTCQCESPGQCPVFKRRMTPLQHATCNGTREGLTPEARRYFVTAWLAAAEPDEDPTLLGNQVAAAAKRLGIPHCGGCEDRRQLLNRAHLWLRGERPAGKLRFVTTAELTCDVALLCSLVPHNLTGIIGVARSGLFPATLAALQLHLPLWIVRQDAEDVIAAGHGFRLGNRDPRGSANDGPPGGTMLLVDDTSMTGNSVQHATDIVKRHWPGQRVKTAVIYRNPTSRIRPDYWVHDLAHPHFLEWNLFNSIHLHKLAVDLDGILTHDGTDRPQYLPRKDTLPLIVTGRSEAIRLPTQAWLARHKVRVKRLVMYPGPTPDDPLVIARYKADHWGRSGLAYFVESEPVQAKEIARLVKRPVVCPAAGEVY
jgi:adenine/guanine phosphoribosyltransferase-like PRPP-binding protein